MQVLKADEVKSDFLALKQKWQVMLGKYYIDPKTLNSEFVCQRDVVNRRFV